VFVWSVEEESKGGSEDVAMILACDGLWDVIDDEQAGKLVFSVKQKRDKAIEEGKDTHALVGSEYLAQAAIDAGSGDNVSVVVVYF
jgi:serine/threonine protein phosphatase PrpC